MRNFVVLFIFVFIDACQNSKSGVIPNIAEKYGLTESANYRGFIERAISIADIVLNDSIHLCLVPSWDQTYNFPTIKVNSNNTKQFKKELTKDSFDIDLTYTNATIIPVYLVDDDKLGTEENVFVPEGEKCIFINCRKIPDILNEFGVGEKTRVQQYSSFENALVFSLILLHETGHIFYNDNGSYSDPSSINAADLEEPKSSRTHNIEVRADKFAVEQTVSSLYSNQRNVWGLGKMQVANNIYRILQTATNAFDYNNDPFGVLDKKPKPYLLKARGYSHPNMFIRFLVMQQLIDFNKERQKIIIEYSKLK